ncbi:MAG: hypothetical protein MUF00_01700 [Gemmatimonadaceae bacterium]|nr:hypothetical protein [Gemmatimonadaceae bacterium]
MSQGEAKATTWVEVMARVGEVEREMRRAHDVAKASRTAIDECAKVASEAMEDARSISEAVSAALRGYDRTGRRYSTPEAAMAAIDDVMAGSERAAADIKAELGVALAELGAA